MAVVGFSLRFDPSVPKSPLRLAFPHRPRTLINYETLTPTRRESQRVRSSPPPPPPPPPDNDSKEDEVVKDLGVKAALSMLKFYKREISPLLLPSCRYVPTCSEYSMEAYKKYGFGKGTILMAWRLCRCNPLGGSGFDPPRWFDEEKPSEQ